MSTWTKVMDCKNAGKIRANGIANNLTDDELNVIVAVVDYFGGDIQQTIFDLKVARYRVFDWLAMGVMGGRIGSENATKVLVYSLLKSNGDIDKFILDLRETDYEIVTDWQEINLDN